MEVSAKYPGKCLKSAATGYSAIAKDTRAFDRVVGGDRADNRWQTQSAGAAAGGALQWIEQQRPATKRIRIAREERVVDAEAPVAVHRRAEHRTQEPFGS